MTTLHDDLSRLADRGPHADCDVVVGRALATAAHRTTTVRRHAPPTLAPSSAQPPAARAQGNAGHPHGRALDGAVVPLRHRRSPSQQRAVWVRGAAAAAMVTVAGGAVVLASGGAGTTPTTTGDQPAPAPIAVEPPPPAASAADADLTATYLSLLDVGTPEEMVTFYELNMPETEIATCMAGGGFEYTPDRTPAEQVAADPLFTLPRAEYAAESGFGVAVPRRAEPSAGEQANQAYVGSLGAEERDRYDAAYRSCRTSPERWARSDALNVALDPVRRTIDADPLMTSALLAWRSCAAEAGHPTDSPTALRQSFWDRVNDGVTSGERAQIHADEVAAATATLSCQAAYDSAYRNAAIAHFPEFASCTTRRCGSDWHPTHRAERCGTGHNRVCKLCMNGGRRRSSWG